MKTRFSSRVKLGDAFPDRPLGTIVLEYGGYPAREARIAWLWLPTWGFEYSPAHDDYRWAQRVLFYHGWYGFSFRWRFP